jgi:hypothetical protein
MEPLLLNYSDAAAALGVATPRIKQLIEEGRLQTVTIGKRRFVTMESLHVLTGRKPSWWNRTKSIFQI